MSRPKIGFLLSAGGSAFERAAGLSGLGAERFHVVVDRPCGAVAKARAAGIAVDEIAEPDRDAFSAAALAAFRAARCDAVITHFSRLVGPSLFERILTVNVHPALLPAFPGLDGVGDAAKARTPLQGATLHLVDAGVDTGPILAQTVHPVPRGATLDWRHRLGFIQKTIVTLLFLDWVEHGLVDTRKAGTAAIDFDRLPDGRRWNPGFCSEGLEARAAALFRDLP